jgi:IS5 family transposase
VRLAREIDWGFLDRRFASVCTPGPGQPGLPTRLVAGLFILKHMHNLSDEALCARWLENPYYQFFCGELSFCHRLPFDRSSLTHWRQRLGEEQLVALIQEGLSVAHKTGALSTRDLERVVVDTTVQPKAIAHPSDARLCHRALENWSIWRDATTCRCGRATGASPSAPQSWSGATRMRTSLSGPAARSSSCAFGSAA